MRITKSKSSRPSRRGHLTASSFEALPDAEKERIFQEIEGKSTEELLSESTPLTRVERARWNRLKKNLGGRPKLGKNGTQNISVTIEKELLKKANAYAKANGLNRSELVSRGLKLAMKERAA